MNIHLLSNPKYVSIKVTTVWSKNWHIERQEFHYHLLGNMYMTMSIVNSFNAEFDIGNIKMHLHHLCLNIEIAYADEVLICESQALFNLVE